MSGFYQAGFSGSLGPNILLAHADGYLNKRMIGITGHYDLISPYPMFAGRDFKSIAQDMRSLSQSGAVSMTVRSDAFFEKTVGETEPAWDWFRCFKTHYITNLSKPWRETAARNAKRYDDRARRTFTFSQIINPISHTSELRRLNRIILNRTQGKAANVLAEKILSEQLGLSGAKLFRASDSNGIQGLALFMVTEKRAYAYMIGATNEARSNNVIYGLYGYALDYFQNEVDKVDFGGAPGTLENQDHPIARFKKLWTNETAQSFICGKIFRPDVYQKLSEIYPTGQTEFFPSYTT